MTDHIPTIIQVAAWVYVIKHILPFILLPIVLVVGYTFLRLTGTTHNDAMKTLAEGIKDGWEDFLNN